jgi:hypothetical protein
MSAFGGKADMTVREIRFRGRYWGQSGHDLLRRICPLLTQSGHHFGANEISHVGSRPLSSR